MNELPIFRLNPFGFRPLDRFPWGSGIFVDAEGAPIVKDGRPVQFLFDSDGYAILVDDGQFVHIELVHQTERRWGDFVTFPLPGRAIPVTRRRVN